MHTFGHPVEIDKIADLCSRFNIALVEDAAESLGSRYKGQQTGTFGLLGAFSFNGNKTITCGGGGMIVTNNKEIGKLAKHLTTQAKLPHRWEFVHDYIGYNYRLPNLNAALACAQMEKLDEFISSKRNLSFHYEKLFEGSKIKFMKEPEFSSSNYWINCILLQDRHERDSFLNFTNENGIMTRPAWTLMNKLDTS
jgi:dTDP-4-amino-4,6-dideoxygalactose transaminase